MSVVAAPLVRWREPLRFAAVGVAQNGINVGAFALAIALGAGWWVAAPVASVVALLVSFVLNRHWTFAETAPARGALPRYAVVFATAVLLGLVILGALVEVGGVPEVLGQVIAIAIVAPLSYMAHRRFSFASPAPHSTGGPLPRRLGARLRQVVAAPSWDGLKPWRPDPPPVTRRELATVVGVGALVGLATYAWFVKNGGWYLDDWGLIFRMREAVEDGSPLSAVTSMVDVNHRPGNAFVYPALYLVGGDGQVGYNAAGMVLATLAGLTLYAALRQAGIATWVAAAAGVAIIVFPVVDSSRLWMAAYVNTWALIVALGGVAVALRGLRRGSGFVRGHAPALLLYAWATLTYELVVGLIAIFGVGYLLVAGRDRAALRAVGVRVLADLAVVGALVGWMATRQTRGAESGVGHMLDRVDDFPRPAYDLLMSLSPAESTLRGPLGLALLIGAGVGLIVLVRDGRGLLVRSWILVAVGGAVAAIAGWLLLLPADPYFIPRETGLGNRTSAIAAPGLVMLVIAVLALVGLGWSALVRLPAAAGAVVVAVLLLAVGSTMWATERDNQKVYGESWTEAQKVVAAVKRAVPEPRPDARFVTFRHPTMLLPADVSVFYYSWDLKDALQWSYDDETLDAFPAVRRGVCQARGYVAAQSERTLRYGDLWFVDVATSGARRVTSRAACAEQLEALMPIATNPVPGPDPNIKPAQPPIQ